MKDRKEWQAPELRRFGSFEEMTKQDKDFLSPSDGYTFRGDPIGNAPPVS
jgi:hypothetical protein